jgi:hypothetical protein
MAGTKKPSTKRRKKEGWGILVKIPHGDPNKNQEAALNESAKKLMPQFVESFAKAHGIDASGGSAIIKR